MADIDPKGLIADSYDIEGIAAEECRSIFLDWALSLPASLDQAKSIRQLLDQKNAADNPDHPMTQILRAGLEHAPKPGRRGGRAARVTPD